MDSSILLQVARVVQILGQIVYVAILLRVIMSWVSAYGGNKMNNQFTRLLDDFTEPIINVARMIPHKWQMIDFAPIIAIIGVDLLTGLVVKILVGLAGG
jgi:uncharacterized protein YggT (Ycf19 family)